MLPEVLLLCVNLESVVLCRSLALLAAGAVALILALSSLFVADPRKAGA